MENESIIKIANHFDIKAQELSDYLGLPDSLTEAWLDGRELISPGLRQSVINTLWAIAEIKLEENDELVATLPIDDVLANFYNPELLWPHIVVHTSDNGLLGMYIQEFKTRKFSGIEFWPEEEEKLLEILVKRAEDRFAAAVRDAENEGMTEGDGIPEAV